MDKYDVFAFTTKNKGLSEAEYLTKSAEKAHGFNRGMKGGNWL